MDGSIEATNLKLCEAASRFAQTNGAMTDDEGRAGWRNTPGLAFNFLVDASASLAAADLTRAGNIEELIDGLDNLIDEFGATGTSERGPMAIDGTGEENRRH